MDCDSVAAVVPAPMAAWRKQCPDERTSGEALIGEIQKTSSFPIVAFPGVDWDKWERCGSMDLLVVCCSYMAGQLAVLQIFVYD